MYEWQQDFAADLRRPDTAEREAVRSRYMNGLGGILLAHTIPGAREARKFIQVQAVSEHLRPLVLLAEDTSVEPPLANVTILRGNSSIGFEGSRYGLAEDGVRRTDYGNRDQQEFPRQRPTEDPGLKSTDELTTDMQISLENDRAAQRVERALGWNDQPIRLQELSGLLVFIHSAIEQGGLTGSNG
jgi:hypothetical protein